MIWRSLFPLCLCRLFCRAKAKAGFVVVSSRCPRSCACSRHRSCCFLVVALSLSFQFFLFACLIVLVCAATGATRRKKRVVTSDAKMRVFAHKKSEPNKKRVLAIDTSMSWDEFLQHLSQKFDLQVTSVALEANGHAVEIDDIAAIHVRLALAVIFVVVFVVRCVRCQVERMLRSLLGSRDALRTSSRRRRTGRRQTLNRVFRSNLQAEDWLIIDGLSIDDDNDAAVSTKNGRSSSSASALTSTTTNGNEAAATSAELSHAMLSLTNSLARLTHKLETYTGQCAPHPPSLLLTSLFDDRAQSDSTRRSSAQCSSTNNCSSSCPVRRAVGRCARPDRHRLSSPQRAPLAIRARLDRPSPSRRYNCRNVRRRPSSLHRCVALRRCRRSIRHTNVCACWPCSTNTLHQVGADDLCRR
jgi:hypothetical protein